MRKSKWHTDVRDYLWREDDGTTVPAIRVYRGAVFTIIHYNEARQVVDKVHDLCDDYEREQRKKAAP